MSSPKNTFMEFGSKYLFLDISKETEEIYQDEIEDGLASCAQEQAEIWEVAAEEQENQKFRDFVRNLRSLAGAYTQQHPN